MKKMMILSLTGLVLASNTLTASAATVKDLFDAEYYAETYPD